MAWLVLNDAFLSVVADRYDPDRLLVRAREAGHIESVFPNAEVIELPRSDYRYRVFVSRDEVAAVLSARIATIAYENFKDSVPHTSKLKGFTSRVWEVGVDVWGAFGCWGERRTRALAELDDAS